MSLRGWLYWLARLLGDVNAVAKGKAGKRIARRVPGRQVLRAWGRLWR